MPAQCPIAVADPLAATVDTFILNTSVVEAVELSNLDSGGSSIDCDRLNSALRDAYNYLQSSKLLLPPAYSAVIDLNLSRWMVFVARYYLDNIRRRPDVTADYKLVSSALEELKSYSRGANTSDTSVVLSQTGALKVSTGKSPVWTERSLSQYRGQL